MNAEPERPYDPLPPSDDRAADDAAGGSGPGEASPPADDRAAERQHAIDAAIDAADDPPAESRDEELERMREEVEQARQRVLMAQAEMENFRKRTRKDFEDRLRFAALPLVEDLLQVRDNLVRASEAANSSTATLEGLRAGVEMVTKQLTDVMAKHGISPIAAVGETFDPNYHQAISQAPSEDHDHGVVAIEATTGFEMHGRVIRPSQVVVSSGKPPS